MSGTIAGGQKAAAKNKANDPLFYQKIGAKGGAKGGGFGYPGLCECGYTGAPHKRASCAGALGGKVSRRIGKKNRQKETSDV